MQKKNAYLGGSESFWGSSGISISGKIFKKFVDFVYLICCATPGSAVCCILEDIFEKFKNILQFGESITQQKEWMFSLVLNFKFCMVVDLSYFFHFKKFGCLFSIVIWLNIFWMTPWYLGCSLLIPCSLSDTLSYSMLNLACAN